MFGIAQSFFQLQTLGSAPEDARAEGVPAERITCLEVRWPRTNDAQVFSPVPLDSWLVIREGQSAFEVRERKSFRF